MPRSDNPIGSHGDDLLGRRRLAEELRDFLRVLPAEQGHVLALTGPWGSGKTSLLALLREAIDSERVVVDFNPWMFSGTNQLVEIFFRELSAQLSLSNEKRFDKIVEALDNYSSLLVPFSWIPFVGPAFKHWKELTAATKQLRANPKGSVLKEKEVLSAALSQLESPVLVFIDDIDRLTSTEVQDLFKLVRLTASFPRVIYVLAYDRFRVEEALTQTGMPGRDYLEKIVQTSIDLPAIPATTLHQQVAEALQEVIDETGGVQLFNGDRWADVFSEVITPFVRNMRDVRRYASSCHLAVAALKERVDLVDILALEALRVFRPDLIAQIAQIRVALTSTRSSNSYEADSPLKKDIESFLALSGDDREVAEALIRRVFPAATQHIGNNSFGSGWAGDWLRKRAVAHPDILTLYLDRVGSTNLTAFERAEAAFGLIEDANALDTYIRGLPASEQESMISALENFETDFKPSAAVPATATILNLYPDLPERPRQFFDLGTRMVVGRVCLRLLRVLESEEDRELAAQAIMVQLKTLSAKFELLSLVGHWENAGHALVSEDFATGLTESLIDEVRVCATANLSNEVQLLQLVYLPKRIGREPLPLNDRRESAFTLALLRGARSETLGQSMGSRAVRRTPTLAWDFLVELYGTESDLITAIKQIDLFDLSEDHRELLALATRYGEGYRPDDFD